MSKRRKIKNIRILIAILSISMMFIFPFVFIGIERQFNLDFTNSITFNVIYFAIFFGSMGVNGYMEGVELKYDSIEEVRNAKIEDLYE